MQLDQHPLPTLSISGDGMLLGANPPACSMTGLQPDAVQGMVIERVLQPVDNGPSLERFLGDLLTRGSGRFDGLLLGGAQKHRVTAWGWRPDSSDGAYWVHLVPAPPPRVAAPSSPAPSQPVLSHLSPSFRAILSSPARVDQLMRLGASAGVLARELLADLMNLSPSTRDHPELKGAMGSLVKVAIALSEHAERVSELTGTAGELIPEVVRAQDALNAIRVLMEGALPEDIHIHVEIEDGAPDPFCHAMALEQALLALCANARDAMPAGGHIILSAHPAEAGRVILSVRDTGQGMREDQMEQAFGTHYGTRGMGLGLPLVRELMDRMDGVVSLESTATVGTTVSLNLPAVESQGAITGQRARVLLVEDNAQLARVTGRLLNQSNMNVTHAADGAEALQLLSGDAPFACVLLDLNLPRATGRDVLNFVQVMQNAPPVVVFTSEDVGAVEEELRGMGAYAVIGKPFRGQELVDLLRAGMKSVR